MKFVFTTLREWGAIVSNNSTFPPPPSSSYRTDKENPPVTFAIAACETQNVNVTVLPCFGLLEGSPVTAKDMWGKMAQVMTTPSGSYMTSSILFTPDICSCPV